MTSKVKGTEGIEFPDATVQSSAGISQVAADARYVNTAGDTMTGNLVINPGQVSVVNGGQATALVGEAGNGSLWYGAASAFKFNGETVAFGGAGLNTGYSASFGNDIRMNPGKGIALVENTNNNVLKMSFPTDALLLSTNGVDRQWFYTDGNIRAPFISTGTGTALVLDGNGYFRANTSSRRYKENIAPIDIGLDFINSLEPVKFTLKNGGAAQVGFIAEDFPDDRLVTRMLIDPADPSKGDQIQGIQYEQITAILTKAIQELTVRVAELETK